MRAVFLVAWREYRQYVFSRGFILFLVMMPLILLFGAFSITLIEKARPIRAFVVYDQTGVYTALIDAQIVKQRSQQLLSAWNLYLETAVDRSKIAPSDIAFPFGSSSITNERLEAFDEAGGFAAARAAAQPYLRDVAPPFVEPRPRFQRLPLPEIAANAPSMDEAAEALRPYLLGEASLPGANGALFAAVLIPEGFAAGPDAPQAQFWSRNLTDPALEVSVARAMAAALRQREAESLGVSLEDLRALADIEAPMSAYRPDRVEADAALNRRDRLESAILPGIMTYMLLVVVFAVGNPLLTNTIEERSNKIVEVLLSSVTADQLMLGKLIGIAAVGLTMPAVFLIVGAAASLSGVAGGELLSEVMEALFTSNLVPVFLFYFLAAYVIFAMMFLAIGALSNSLQDAQTFMGPLMLIVFAPMPFVVMMFQNPNGLVASILTWIPIYTPYAVMMRAAADPPLWEIVGATILMLAFAAALARLMGRIFKNALLSSAPAKASDVWRLARSEAG